MPHCVPDDIPLLVEQLRAVRVSDRDVPQVVPDDVLRIIELEVEGPCLRSALSASVAAGIRTAAGNQPKQRSGRDIRQQRREKHLALLLVLVTRLRVSARMERQGRSKNCEGAERSLSTFCSPSPSFVAYENFHGARCEALARGVVGSRCDSPLVGNAWKGQ